MHLPLDKAIQIPFPLFQDLQNYLQSHEVDDWAATLLERLQTESIVVELNSAPENTDDDEDIEF